MPLPWTGLALDGWLLLALAGGAAAMDGSAWPQSMLCRPVVAATVGGAVAGTAGDGLLVGIALEILWIPFPPFGAARRPEAGPASIVAGAAFAGAGAGGTVGLLAAILVAWGAGWLSAATLGWQWRWNAALVAGRDRALDPAALETRQRLGPPLAFLRGFVVTGALAVPAMATVGASVRLLADAGGGAAGAGSPPAAGWILAAVLGVAAGAGVRSLGGGRRGLVLAGAGMAAAAAVLAGGLP